MPVAVALWGVAALFAAAVLAIAIHRFAVAGRLIYLICLVACLANLGVAGMQLLAGAGATAPAVRLPVGLPWIGAHFRMDALSAFFSSSPISAAPAPACSPSATARTRRHRAGAAVLSGVPRRHEPRRPGRRRVHLSGGLEFMSLSSWALVMAHHHDPDNRSAGYIYIVMAGFGTLTLLLAFGLLAGGAGGYAFADIRSADQALPGLVLILVLIGTGSKAGLVPLHVWLPLAHPAAPSHVSALMSGVMTKVAVYGFVRIVFDLVGQPAWWWSILVIGIAGITCVMGVLSALMQHDLKRLLAYHTVENIGIVFIGLGLALAFSAHGMQAPAALALTAALFHVFNHCVFKSLLFFGAGAVLNATGERDMEHLGGLIHRMPDHRLRLPHRLHRHLRTAAAQRLRLGVADLPGDLAEPGAALGGGLKIFRAGGRGHAGAVGGARRRPASSRPSRHPFWDGRARRSPASARTRSIAPRSRPC
jgi:formate hydrogenlyase subunit 3/multisubunit Na+/H+ antiporter MnhD subunit